jgi:hypothetical protein
MTCNDHEVGFFLITVISFFTSFNHNGLFLYKISFGVEFSMVVRVSSISFLARWGQQTGLGFSVTTFGSPFFTTIVVDKRGSFTLFELCRLLWGTLGSTHVEFSKSCAHVVYIFV